jgi:pyrrolidone-carboxylate peptidase
MAVGERTQRTRSTQPARKDSLPAPEILHQPGYRLDPVTRATMAARFGHDFSHVRIHSGEEAGRTAAALGARALTVGHQIVFGRGLYAPHRPAGQSLLAHELAHTIQQAEARPGPDLAIAAPDSAGEVEARRAARQASYVRGRPRLTRSAAWQVQRVSIWESIARFFGYGSYSDQELADYLRGLRERGRPENSIDSDDKARATTQRWITGSSPFVLTPPLIALLILEMQLGFTGDEDEQAILELLERCENHELATVFQTVNPRTLNSDFHGAEWDRLQEFYRRRFQGGMEAVLNGQIRPMGDAVPLGTPLSARREQSAQDPNRGDEMIAAQCTIREPENCHSYEDWIRQFSQLPTFGARSGHRVIGPAAAPEATATDPSANPSARRPALAHGRQRYLSTDRFIDGPTDQWVNDNLPRHLVRVAYQLPSDCADIAVILRHVWLVAHHRTEVYQGWLVGSELDNPRSAAIQQLIRGQVSSGNVARIVRPYTGPDGSPIRSFAQLERLLHPGDVLVWEHQGRRGGRTGGHAQTITEIHRTGDTITQIDVLQGNQPISREQAETIRAEDRTAPSVADLRAAPGRRIEVSQLRGRENLRGHRLRDLGNVWGWLQDPADPRSKRDMLVAAGPPAIGDQPGSRRSRRGSDVVRGLEDWSAQMGGAQSLSQLQSYFEAALLEARSLIEGGQADSLTEEEARSFGRAAGEAVWRLANQSARQRSEFAARSGASPRRILDTHLMAEDLGAEAHYRPLRHMLGMLDSLGRLARVDAVRERFDLIRGELEPAARGMTAIAFQRPGIPAGTQLANVLVTGFDPFRFNAAGRQTEPEAGDWNPSGAAVLQLDGELVDARPNLKAAVEGVIFPVRYDQFRAGLVESVVRPLLPRVHGVVTVSMDPNIAPDRAAQMERYAVGMHRLNNGVLENIPPVTVQGAPRRTDPGPAILPSQGDLAGIAREAGLPETGIDSEVRLEFDTVEEANRFRGALGLRNAQMRQVAFDFLAHANQIGDIQRGVQSSAITLRAGNQSFQATILRGPGGSFLSNEVSYRVLRAIHESAQRGRVTSFHVHTPRGTAQPGERIPQAAETAVERSTRFQALQTARGVLTRLVDTLRRMVAAIARRAFPQGTQSP